MKDINRQPEIRIIPMPANTNSAGDVFGGWLMSQVDLAGSIAAHRVTHNRVATVAVNNFIFIKPVFVGDLISIYSKVEHIGTTSIRIMLEVIAERERGKHPAEKVAEATLTFVNVDKDRQPQKIKP